MRRTSQEAYHLIKENGLLSKRRFEVYETLYHHGPLTAGETRIKIPGAQLNSISPRMAELRELGVVVEVTERPCSVTGMKAIAWDVTDKLPVKWDKPIKHTCKVCDGKGYVLEQQQRLF